MLQCPSVITADGMVPGVFRFICEGLDACFLMLRVSSLAGARHFVDNVRLLLSTLERRVHRSDVEVLR